MSELKFAVVICTLLIAGVLKIGFLFVIRELEKIQADIRQISNTIFIERKEKLMKRKQKGDTND